ncbi:MULTISPECIES: hypothetical protein [Spirulina sp. CCY15215]|uniref:hypothetical protein n=1 Tax=Spirulina sp. CCY15215 TaxID=2767591 RepID=UPI001951D9AE|nr:hypothetical protein [Spirulina major]
MNTTSIANLDPIDRQILQAFISALSQLEQPLPASLVAKINQVGHDLQQNSIDSIHTLEEIAHEYNPLKELYEQTCNNLQGKYEPQELPKPVPNKNLKSHLNTQKTNSTIPPVTSNDTVAQKLRISSQHTNHKFNYSSFNQ